MTHTESDLTAVAANFARVGESVRYQGQMVRMSTTHWLGPDGVEFQRDFVAHPGAVAVVPILDDGSIVLVRQFRTPLNGETLELPAGVRDVDGETAAEAASRELAEETGYVADKLTELAVIHSAPGWSDEEITLFVATGLHANPRRADGIEEQHMSVEVLAPHQFDDLVADGSLTDAKTVAGVLLARSRG